MHATLVALSHIRSCHRGVRAAATPMIRQNRPQAEARHGSTVWRAFLARRGEQFERVVYEFARELMPEAVVQFDVKVPDVQTGTLRQADAWITLRLGDHIPMSILVSCKDHSRPLDIGEAETFAAEMRSLGATQGVLYSRSGFTEPAVAKARASGVSCCRFFDDAPPEKPSELLLSAYVALPGFFFHVEAKGGEAPPELLWRDVLSLHTRIGQDTAPIAAVIEAASIGLFNHSDASGANGLVHHGPEDARADFELQPVTGCPPFRISMYIVWAWYYATLNAFRLVGSFNVTAPDFKGKARVPAVPLDGGPLGDGWESCPKPPASDPRARITLRAIGLLPQQLLYRTLAARSVFASGPCSFPAPTAPDIPAMLGGVFQQTAPRPGFTIEADFGRTDR
ncbi:MAG: restriction endonuclease [Phycisphaerales bacterium]